MSEESLVAEFRTLQEKLSNWGRWGAEDQLGTANLIGGEEVKAALREVQTGEVHSLAITLGPDGPQTGAFGRFNPIHLMLRDGGDALSGAYRHFSPGGVDREMRGTDDIIIMPLQAGTHWDGFAHMIHRDVTYNGVSAAEVTSTGARRNSIDVLRSSLLGRGVLLDIPRLLGKDWLEPGYAVTRADLNGAVAEQGVEIRAGDIVLVRTGHDDACLSTGGWGDYAGGPSPGLSFRTAEWFWERDVAAVATDTFACEVMPNELDTILRPFHLLAIVYMGLVIGEVFSLGELARECASDGRYTFFFAGQPLPFEGAVGSPINPIAIR